MSRVFSSGISYLCYSRGRATPCQSVRRPETVDKAQNRLPGLPILPIFTRTASGAGNFVRSLSTAGHLPRAGQGRGVGLARPLTGVGPPARRLATAQPAGRSREAGERRGAGRDPLSRLPLPPRQEFAGPRPGDSVAYPHDIRANSGRERDQRPEKVPDPIYAPFTSIYLGDDGWVVESVYDEEPKP